MNLYKFYITNSFENKLNGQDFEKLVHFVANDCTGVTLQLDHLFDTKFHVRYFILYILIEGSRLDDLSVWMKHELNPTRMIILRVL